MTSDVDMSLGEKRGECMLQEYHRMDINEKKEAMLRLVEAQIAGCVDLSPEEMVDAAFVMMQKINEKLNVGGVVDGPACPPELQLR